MAAPRWRHPQAGAYSRLDGLPELQGRVDSAAAGARLARSRGAVLQAAIDAHVEARRLSDATLATTAMRCQELEARRECAELGSGIRCMWRREQDAHALIESDGELLACERSRAWQRARQVQQMHADLGDLREREFLNLEKISCGLLSEQSAVMQHMHRERCSLQERIQEIDAEMEQVARGLPDLLSDSCSVSSESKRLESKVLELRRGNCAFLMQLDEHTGVRESLRQRCRCIGLELRELEQRSKEYESQQLSCTTDLGRAALEQLDLLDVAHTASMRHRKLKSHQDAFVAKHKETLLRRKSHAFAEAASVLPSSKQECWPSHCGVMWREDLAAC